PRTPPWTCRSRRSRSSRRRRRRPRTPPRCRSPRLRRPHRSRRPPPRRQYPPPIGREAELARFAALLERLERGRGGVVLVEGEPGIGKTRLLHTVVDDAAARGFVTALGRCHESGAAPPYWPLTQVGRTLAERLGVGVVAAAAGAWAPHLQPFVDGPAAGAPDPDAAPQFLLAEAIVEALRKLAVGRRLVLALDDVYGADPDSLDVLVRLAAVLPAEPILVIASYRTADLAPDHPLALALGELSRVAEVERMTLTTLSADGVGELLARETGGPVAAELAAGIHARSGGNPFFVIELARLLRAEGEDALAAGTVPAGVRDVIRRRLARLPEETRHVLTVAAVAGRDFDLELVTDICGLSDDRALDHLELALVSQLVGEGTRPGAFRFSHALVREAVAETVSALRRARTHRQVADALERLYGADPDRWIAIAHHAAQAVPVTGPAAALPAVTRAARSAVTAQAPELAQRLFDQRLALAVALPPSADRDGVEMEALLDLLTIWTWTEGFHSERVEEASARVVELAGRTGQTAPVLGAFMARASWLSVSGRHLDSERNSADLDALAAVDDTPMVRFCADFSGGVAALYRGRIVEAQARFAANAARVEVVDPGVTGAVMLPPGQQSLASAHHLFRGWAHALAGDAAAARSELDCGMAVARRAEHAFSVAFAAVLDCIASASMHDPLGAEPAVAAGLAVCRERGFPLQQLWLEAFGAWLVLGRGDASRDALAQIIDALAAMGAACVHTLMRSWLVEHDLAAGRPDAALAELDGIEVFAAGRGEGFWLAELARLRALALHALGDRAGAAAALSAAADLAAQAGAGHLAERVAATRLA
ncbi:MAG TPA: AAA family ATPase, partial [Egibacteraceae bacterium]